MLIRFGTCSICGKFTVMKPRAKRCDDCALRGYTVKRNPYRKKKETSAETNSRLEGG